MYEPLAVEALAVDLILGAGFGAIDVSGRPKDTRFRELIGRDPTQDEIDAARGVAAERHFEGLAPGIPIDGRAVIAHRRAMEMAAEQVLAGEPVNVQSLFEPRLRLAGLEPDDIALLAREAEAEGDQVGATALSLLARERGAALSDADTVLRAPPPGLSPRDFAQTVQERIHQIERETVAPEFLTPEEEGLAAQTAVLNALAEDPAYAEALGTIRRARVEGVLPPEELGGTLLGSQRRAGNFDPEMSLCQSKRLPLPMAHWVALLRRNQSSRRTTRSARNG
ncbi:MAG: hypothetical protein HC909_02920 [Blastochloris sp.]|nr:hypothetical protein [Blastochloris sp.]